MDAAGTRITESHITESHVTGSQITGSQSLARWTWRISRFIGLAAACGLGVFAGVVVVTLAVIGWMSTGWALVIALTVIALVLAACSQLMSAASRRRLAEQVAAIAAGGG